MENNKFNSLMQCMFLLMFGLIITIEVFNLIIRFNTAKINMRVCDKVGIEYVAHTNFLGMVKCIELKENN